jgi:hypothetical protein
MITRENLVSTVRLYHRVFAAVFGMIVATLLFGAVFIHFNVYPNDPGAVLKWVLSTVLVAFACVFGSFVVRAIENSRHAEREVEELLAEYREVEDPPPDAADGPSRSD